MTPAHTVLAQACLGILLHLEENAPTFSLAKFPLAKYAAKYWVQHARFEGVSQSAEDAMKRLFDTSKPHLAVWLGIYDPLRGVYPKSEVPLRPVGTPLHYAAFCGLHTVVKFLSIKHSQDVHSGDVGNKSTPLHLASGAGHVEVVRVLVDHGADVTAQDNYGSTPLHRVSLGGNVDITRFLVEHGADATAQNKNGSTPLHHASFTENVDVARFLVEHGVTVTAQDKNGWTPLHQLSQSIGGNVDLARFLIEHGADVTTQDNNGLTPLHIVSLSGRVDLAHFLVEHGADVRAQSNDWLTPLHHVSTGGNVDVAQFSSSTALMQQPRTRTG